MSPDPDTSAPVDGVRARAPRDLVTDIVGLGGLGLVAVSGLRLAYGGTSYLVVGAAGLVAGMAVAVLAARRSRSLWFVLLSGIVLYLVLGGPLVVPDETVAVVVPTPASVAALADAAVRSWMNVLTTVPPVGGAPTLAAVPLICGLVAGIVSMSIARRARRAVVAALLAPLGVLVVGILLGVDEPAWSGQATAFVVLALAWASSRQRSARTAGLPSLRASRWLGTVAVLTLAAGAGLVVGRSDLVLGDRERLVVRDEVDPPVDLRRFPSPLEGFRSFQDPARRNDVIFEVTGLEDGDRLRLATLDSYDGVVWHVLDESTADSSSGVFQRVGEDLPVTEDGDARSLTVEVGEYDGPWLPTMGATASVSFDGERATELAEGFRYNLVTDTAAEPSGLRPGDRYTLSAVVPPDRADRRDGAPDSSVVIPDPVRGLDGSDQAEVDPIASTAAEYGEGATALARVRAVEDALREHWYFSDGRTGEDEPEKEFASRPGHSLERIHALLDPEGARVGNEEQYASAMALLADELGVPARVVVGFAPARIDEAGTTEVTGEDITAWVEVAVADVGWVPLFPTPEDTREPEEQQERQVPPPNRLELPPPSPTTTVPSAANPPDPCDPEEEDCDAETSRDTSAGGIPVVVAVAAVPFLFVGAVTATMAGAKARRRSRRRRRGSASSRIAAGWDEICDLARDLGDVTPLRATRREAAVILARPGVADLARSADTLVFGPITIEDPVIEAYWREVETTRRAMLDPLGRVDRWKALVNPTSLRAGRGATGPTTQAARRRWTTS